MNKIYSILALAATMLFAVACSSDSEQIKNAGYLRMEINTLVSTKTRAVTKVPENYAPKTLYVEILDAQNNIVKSTHDFENDTEFQGNIELEPGTYTINAHSDNWDGSASAIDAPFYAGSTTVTIEEATLKTANITCTLANVKVTVTFDASFEKYFNKAIATISSDVDGVSNLVYTMGQTQGSAYFPVGTLRSTIVVENKAGEAFSQENVISEDVAPRDHYILNYRVADAGTLGEDGNPGISVSIDPTTHTYTYTFPVPTAASVTLKTTSAAPWSKFATVSGAVTAKDDAFDASRLKLQYKKASESEWTDFGAITLDGKDEFTTRITGLESNTEYAFRMHYIDANNDEVKSDERTFKTEAETGIYNNSFENWWVDGKVAYPNERGTSFWSSSNSGSADYIGSVTTQSTDKKSSGTSSAKLETKWAAIKLAAGSLFTGNFIGLIGINGAKLDWGVPFTSRPSALKGYLHYTPGTINRGNQPSGVGAPAKNDLDACQIFCALLTEQLHVGGNASSGIYEKSTEIQWGAGTAQKPHDARIIAYGELTQQSATAGSAMQSFTIPLTYYDTTKKPAYLLIVCSSSKWGDYFYGSDSSVMYVDDFTFDYASEPVIAQ